jgi:hypothetical protein
MDARERIWTRIEELAPGTAKNRLALGQCFHELRNLYSDRQADVRRAIGHGVFEAEIAKRGYKPRTVREWVKDYEANLAGAPSSAAKRKARRQTKPSADALTEFAVLLPRTALKAAYREAAKILHPDHGGNERKMQRLNAAWERVEKEMKDSQSLP